MKLSFPPLALSLLLSLSPGLTACSEAPPTATTPAVQQPSSGTQSNSGESSSSQDASLKDELAQILQTLEPGIQEKSAVSEITLAQAEQIAVDLSDTAFKVQNYQPLAPSALEILLQRAEIFPTDNIISAYMTDGSRSAIIQRFKEQLQDVLGNIPFTHFGLAAIQQGQSYFVSVVLITEIVTLENAPITRTAPGPQQVSGEIQLQGYQQPRFLMTRPDGQVVEVPTEVSEQRFSATIPFDSPGLYSLEVDVQGPLGPLPASNYVVAVGEDYPTPIQENIQTEKIDSIERAQASLLELVNRDRASMGLEALRLDAELSAAAQSHSEDMVQNHFVGHNSPTHGTPQMQAARQGISDLVAQNISLSRTLERAQAELMSSPGHRKTILEPHHSHAGFGVKTAEDGFLYITQFFLQRVIQIEALPQEVERNARFQVRGSSTRDGFVGVFVGNQIQGDPLEVKANEAFEIPLQLKKSGPERLRIGYSEPPNGGAYNFVFYNIWDLEVR